MTIHTGTDRPDDPRGLDELMANMRGVQLYMIRMDMPHPVASPLEYLTPLLREHILWLEAQERAGTLFLSGANAAGDRWDGSGTAIVRAKSLEQAVALAETEPFHQAGLRANHVHGWLLNEGTVHLTVNLFSDAFRLR